MLHAISQRTILKRKADVLVIGAGLAGIIGAISAAEAGASVCLASSGSICSGSSFYPGTWGFGLVGPEDEKDEADLVNTITRVGMDVVDPSLVKVFVSGINAGITYLENMGVPLKKAENPGEREFIPCFDHKCRSWHGIIKEDAKPVFLSRLEALGVVLLPNTEITELFQESGHEGSPGRITGAVGIRDKKEWISISCKSVIIASGGIGGLFQYRLNPGDVRGTGQYLALKAGASLVNLEFMQMMPGFVSPAFGTVFNEKIFRYTVSPAYEAWSEEEQRELLEARSGHGPFTSRLKSRQVDEAINRESAKTGAGARITYMDSIKENQPEFVKTYVQWMEREKHLTLNDPVQVGIFAHASNGGIYIDENGYTGVEGLYACGEVTGGMHGADRLGGLSTANGLVFGRRAGRAAAQNARMVTGSKEEPDIGQWNADFCGTLYSGTAFRNVEEELRKRMQLCGMIARNEECCQEMLDWLGDMAVEWNQSIDFPREIEDYLEATRLKAELVIAGCFMQAVLLRKESRGSHYRTDYPDCNPDYAHMIVCSYDGKKIVDRWI